MGLFSGRDRRSYPAHTGPAHNGYNNNNNYNGNNGYNGQNGYNSHDGRNDIGSPTRGRSSRREKRQGRTSNREPFNIESGYFNRRPTFGQWIKMTWLDILTMIIMGAIGLGVYEANPAPSRSFPVTFSDGEIVYPEFTYPLRNEIIPIWAAALMAALIPILIILCMQIRIRSFWDVNNAVIGLLYSLIGAAVFQVFVKWLIGGLRPHFLAVCDPDPAKVIAGGDGFRSVMFQPDICRGDQNQINDSLESMPSGHSTAAWAGFLYLYYYLNAKMKVFSNHHPAMWKLIALYSPLLGATLITGALTIDEFHNWYDCLAGALIGSVFATSAYRMVYASIWDFRFNHIPLTRHTPFSYGAGAAGAGGFESTVFTRKAGWGFEEAYGGAPFDAAHGLRGQETGFNQGAAGLHHDHHNKRNTTHDRNHGGAKAAAGGGFLGGLMGGRRRRDRHNESRHNDSRHNDIRHNDVRRDDVEHNAVGTHAPVGNTHHGGGGYVQEPTHHQMQPTHHQSPHHQQPINHNNAPVYDNVTHGGANTTGYNNNNNNNSNDPFNHNRGGGGAFTTNRDPHYVNDPQYINDPVTPTHTQDNRYHQHSRSVERRPLPSGNRRSGDY